MGVKRLLKFKITYACAKWDDITITQVWRSPEDLNKILAQKIEWTKKSLTLSQNMLRVGKNFKYSNRALTCMVITAENRLISLKNRRFRLHMHRSALHAGW